MKKQGGIWLIVALALLLALPTAAQAEMYGEVYLGGVRRGRAITPINGNFSGTTPGSGSGLNWQDSYSGSFRIPGNLSPQCKVVLNSAPGSSGKVRSGLITPNG